jgi:hypothetical protein
MVLNETPNNVISATDNNMLYIGIAGLLAVVLLMKK